MSTLASCQFNILTPELVIVPAALKVVLQALAARTLAASNAGPPTRLILVIYLPAQTLEGGEGSGTRSDGILEQNVIVEKWTLATAFPTLPARSRVNSTRFNSDAESEEDVVARFYQNTIVHFRTLITLLPLLPSRGVDPESLRYRIIEQGETLGPEWLDVDQAVNEGQDHVSQVVALTEIPVAADSL